MKALSLIAAVSILTVRILPGQNPSPPLVPPKVVETSPKAWQTGVSAPQNQVSVTFDQPMSPAYTAWIGRSSVVQEVNPGSSVSPDRHTFTTNAVIQAGKVYVFSLNEKGIPGVGFQNNKGLSAPPYFLVFQTAGNVTPDEAPPRAVSTIPSNGAQQLDSTNLKSITITFDKAMQSSKHGLHMRENGKDIDVAKARFQYSPNGRSFTLAYDFKPSSKYEFVLNSTQDIGFATTKRIPLWPVQFAFTTA